MPRTKLPAERLQDALAAVEFPVSPPLLDELRKRVCEYVDSLKSRDWPPERVIVAVKQIAHEAGFHPSPLVQTEALMSARDELLVAMVGWCIERYYRP